MLLLQVYPLLTFMVSIMQWLRSFEWAWIFPNGLVILPMHAYIFWFLISICLVVYLLNMKMSDDAKLVSSYLFISKRTINLFSPYFFLQMSLQLIVKLAIFLQFSCYTHEQCQNISISIANIFIMLVYKS